MDQYVLLIAFHVAYLSVPTLILVLNYSLEILPGLDLKLPF